MFQVNTTVYLVSRLGCDEPAVIRLVNKSSVLDVLAEVEQAEARSAEEHLEPLGRLVTTVDALHVLQLEPTTVRGNNSRTTYPLYPYYNQLCHYYIRFHIYISHLEQRWFLETNRHCVQYG